jgi:hypothetical protein
MGKKQTPEDEPKPARVEEAKQIVGRVRRCPTRDHRKAPRQDELRPAQQRGARGFGPAFSFDAATSVKTVPTRGWSAPGSSLIAPVRARSSLAQSNFERSGVRLKFRQ